MFKAISIILNISNKIYHKESLISIVKKILIKKLSDTNDSLVYFYNSPEDQLCLKQPSYSVSKISEYLNKIEDLEIALKQSICAVCSDDYDNKKIILITDYHRKYDNICIKRSLNFNIKEDAGCTFYFININEDNNKLLDDISNLLDQPYIHQYNINPEELSELINEIWNE